MADVTPASGGHQDVLTELAAEVKIPINEVFIGLDVPNAWFVDDRTRTQNAAGLRATAAALKSQASVLLSTGQPEMIANGVALQASVPELEAQAAQLEKPMHPQLFLVETYRLTTLRTASGKGPRVNSSSLLPGEEKTFEIRTSFMQSQDRTKTTTVMESEDDTVARDFNQHIAQSATDHQSKDSLDYHLDANFHGDASVGFGSGEANASLSAKGGSNDVRSDFGHAVENAADKQIAQTSASRQQSVSSGTADDKTTSETSTLSRDTIKNPNPTHTVNVFWFQLLDQYTSFLALVDAEIVYKTSDPSLDQRVALHDLDKLLARTVVEDKRAAVHALIRGELSVVLDYQNTPTDVAEEVSLGSDSTILRFKPNLQSTFMLKNGAGELERIIKVDGLLTRAYSRVIPSRQVVSDLVVGETSAI